MLMREMLFSWHIFVNQHIFPYSQRDQYLLLIQEGSIPAECHLVAVSIQNSANTRNRVLWNCFLWNLEFQFCKTPNPSHCLTVVENCSEISVVYRMLDHPCWTGFSWTRFCQIPGGKKSDLFGRGMAISLPAPEKWHIGYTVQSTLHTCDSVWLGYCDWLSASTDLSWLIDKFIIKSWEHIRPDVKR